MYPETSRPPDRPCWALTRGRRGAWNGKRTRAPRGDRARLPRRIARPVQGPFGANRDVAATHFLKMRTLPVCLFPSLFLLRDGGSPRLGAGSGSSGPGSPPPLPASGRGQKGVRLPLKSLVRGCVPLPKETHPGPLSTIYLAFWAAARALQASTRAPRAAGRAGARMRRLGGWSPSEAA